MSIFDVIKYQLSDCPTLNELESLPDSIYQYAIKWIMPGRELTYKSTVSTIIRIYYRQPANRHIVVNMVAELRKALYEL